MTAGITIRVLGPLEVEGPDGVVSIGSAMQRRLLTALVVADGATVSADRLTEALWGAHPPASARNSLQTYVARLRDLLGDTPTIVTRPPGYALDPGVVEVDAHQVVAARDLAREALPDRPGEAVQLITDALGRWRGEPHAEFEHDIAREDAVRLTRLRAELMDLLAEAQERCGHPGRALAVLDQAHAEDPLREPVVVATARLLAGRGDLPAALAALRDHRTRLADELGLDPGEAFRRLERQLLRGDASALPGVAPSAVATTGHGQRPRGSPRIGSTTIGRERDLARLAHALEQSPLVTLVGPGGVGKTRLAAVLAHRAGTHAWVDLASVRREGDIAPAIIDGLGLTRGAADVTQVAVEGLAHFPGQVVLDNCEHVIDAVAALLDAALGRGGQVQVLATSRERLDIPGEMVVTVSPLPVPAPEDATETDPAVQLFLDRFTTVGGGTVPAADAARVAAGVDGLPLGIELAAARAAALPIDDLLARLPEHLDVLAGTRRRHGDRHRTLTGVIEWSYDLLVAHDRVLLRRLAVFAGAFTIEAAERVCADEQLPAPDLVVGLGRLVEQSLVARTDDGCLRLLEPIRLYAAERLRASDDEAAVHRRHTDAMLAMAVRADDAVSGPDEAEVIAEVERCLPDVRAARARALAAGDLDTIGRLAGRLYRFAYVQARSDVLAWGAALEDDDAAVAVEPDVRGRAIAAAAGASFMTGALDLAMRRATLAESLTRDPWSCITVQELIGDVCVGRGHLDRARDAYGAMVTLSDHLGHDGLASQGLAGVALVHVLAGDVPAARTVAEASLQRARASGAASVQALAEYTFGEVVADQAPDEALAALDRARHLASSVRASFLEWLAGTADVTLRGRHGDPREALARYDEALRFLRAIGAEGIAVTALRNLVVLLVRIGADVEALQLYRALERVDGKPSFGEEQRRMVAAIEAARDRLGPTADERTSEGAVEGDVQALLAHALRTIDGLRDRLAGTSGAV